MKNIFNKSLCFVYLTYCIISYGCTFPDIPDSKKDSREKLKQVQALITKIAPDQANRLHRLVIEYQIEASVISASLEQRWSDLANEVQDIRHSTDNLPTLQIIPSEN
ncbi:hypothetical protein E3J79_01210 [Candidatus Dependentiae bacterium]|nr:MAG: hypothetical protein E3J79_01210 [Candidatus Dependentiae bacterium]